MVLLVRLALIGLLALANPAIATPQLGKSRASRPGTTPTTAAAPNPTTTVGPKPASTSLISIPDSAIDAAVIVDLPPTNSSLKQIQGAPLSDVLAARPDIQEKIKEQPSLEQSIKANETLPKRAVSKRQINPLSNVGFDCVNNGGPKFLFGVWFTAVKKVCNHWFPHHTKATYVPSGAGFAAQFSVGNGGGITLTFNYGVTDLGSGFLFYEPFSYDICVADLTGLIGDMQAQCLPEDGVDLGFVPLNWDDVVPFSPSLKFYGFHD